MNTRTEFEGVHTSLSAGRTPFFASQADPRFSYCLYVPRTAKLICVYVHGTERDAASYRDALVDFAEANHCLILAPLFHAGIYEPDDLDNYKNIRFHDIRFDHLLLSMVDEVALRYSVDGSQFLLGGFSGGAHFAHRFFLLHPQRLRGVSIAAPGRVTLLDDQRDWWVGVRDLEQQFGQAVDVEAMRRVRVQCIVGADDNNPAENVVDERSTYWMDGAADMGRTRVERMRKLHASYRQHGISSTLEIVPEARHEIAPLWSHIIAFFEQILLEDWV